MLKILTTALLKRSHLAGRNRYAADAYAISLETEVLVENPAIGDGTIKSPSLQCCSGQEPSLLCSASL
ncbi:hypothetical protein C5167_026489 [Papaver somniferum]|nr:hypothetical protein C5167_026489 [Papaver somniferum]